MKLGEGSVNSDRRLQMPRRIVMILASGYPRAS